MAIKQENKHNVQPGEIFTFKNASGYTWTERITKVTDKSVFKVWPTLENCSEMRESWNTFNKKIENMLVERRF